jgi:hypothetical protein
MTLETLPSTNGHIEAPARPKRIVVISGFAESSRDMASRVPDDWEVWGLNRCHTFLKRWDRWFEVHDAELYSGKTGLREDQYMDLLRKSDKPIYMQHPDPSLPMARQLPYKEMVEHFGRDYYTTSIAYMIAMAIYEHDLGDTIDELHMYGVDMSAYSEYSYQRPCVEYWLGMAEGRGIPVTVPKVSPVLKTIASYGRHSERVLWAQASERMATLKDSVAKQSANLQSAIGAQTEYQHVQDPMQLIPADLSEAGIMQLSSRKLRPTLLLVADHIRSISERAKNRFREIQSAIPQMQADLNASLGAQRECQHWLTAISAPQSEDQEPDPIKLPG